MWYIVFENSMVLEILLRSFLLLSISGIGFFISKKFKLNSKDISTILIYVISPFVIFFSIIQSPADWSYLAYSISAFTVASFMALSGLIFAKFFWKDNHVNLFAFAAGTGNTGYFALPLIFAIFDENQIAISIFIIIGVNLYEFTIGYFLTAKGSMGYKDSVMTVIKMPILYAAMMGILFKYLNIDCNETVTSFLSNFKGAYSVLGMMTIGITLAQFSNLKVDWLYSALSLFWKHIVYPITALIVFTYIIPTDLKTLQVITLMVATPIAANVVIISTNLGVHPEKAVISVVLSTIVSVFTIPLIFHLISL